MLSNANSENTGSRWLSTSTTLCALRGQLDRTVKDFCQKRWDEREEEWRAGLGATVGNAVAEQEKILTKEHNAAVQRAVAAENKVKNPGGQVQEAQNMAIELREAAEEQWKRAEDGKKRADLRRVQKHNLISRCLRSATRLSISLLLRPPC